MVAIAADKTSFSVYMKISGFKGHSHSSSEVPTPSYHENVYFDNLIGNSEVIKGGEGLMKRE